jgi:N-acyl-D-aspartate/D-glutamate deacylase
MGERGLKDERASAADLAAMQALLRDAMAGGALGVSTSRTTAHRTPGGDPIPGTFAAPEELMALGRVLAEFNAGVFELAAFGAMGEASRGTVDEVEWMEDVARATGRPVRFGLVQNQTYPDEWRLVLERVEAAQRRGAHVVPEVATRGVGILLNVQNLSPVLIFPAGVEYAGATKEELRALVRDPAVRAKLCASLDESGGRILAGYATIDTVYTWRDEGELSYETVRENAIVTRAEREGRHPGEVLLDLLAEDLDGFYYIPILNQDLGAVETMLRHPATIPGLGDAGAHCGQICDASVTTFCLAYWARRRGVWSVEQAVKKFTLDPAMLYGIRGRGLVRRGWQADLNVIDLGRLGVCPPEISHDFPTGARHLVQRAKGFVATVVNGTVTMRDGVHTGALPGRVVRNEAAA